jgi:3-oxoacyl-[acyl-carrier-protein] synthase-3
MTGVLRASEPSGYSRILGVAGARGPQIVDNDALSGPINSSDEWIRRRTGIVTRRRAPRDVLVQDLAEHAARQAIAAAGIEAAQIDAVLVSTVSWMQPTPGMAPVVAARVGASPSAAAYDINAGCAGFCYGIAQADAMIRTGLARHVLVIGAEKLSDYGDPTDRSISFIIGDGAGAVVLGPSDVPEVGPTIWGSDGTRSNAITMTGTWLDYKYATGPIPWPTARQEGPSVFRWATSVVPQFARQAIDAAGLQPEDIDVFIPHQANARIIDVVAEQLGLRDDVVVARDVTDTGNTSGASVPLAMERLLREGSAHGGQLALQFGFGAGLCYAAQVVRLPAHVGGDGELPPQGRTSSPTDGEPTITGR